MDPNRYVERIPIPGPDEPWWPVVNEFALTFNAYDRVGPMGKVARIANNATTAFAEDGRLPKTADRIRTCLFFEQRRWRHLDADAYQDPPTKAYIQALLARLSELCDGFVDGPGDPYP
jgi:hypothetical protein